MKSPHPRPLRIAALAAAGAVSLALFAHTLNITPGNYEVVSTSQMNLPPDMAARIPPDVLKNLQQPKTHQTCIKETDLEKVSRQIAQGQNQDNPDCKVTEHKIEGNTVSFAEQCPNHTLQFHGTFTSNSFQGTVVTAGAQGRVTVNMTAHRLGSC